MFATIRKHQTWLWGFIIAAVIVSFVIYFTPSVTRDRSGGGRSQFGSLNGRPITRKQFLEAYVETRLSYLLRFGTWPDQGESKRTGFDLDRETRNRLVLLERLRALNVLVEKEAVAQWIVDNFGGTQPATAKAKYDNFVRELRQRHTVTEEDLQNFIRHEIGVGHLAAVAGVAGKLVTPRLAAELYRQENEKVEAEAVVFAASNYLASVTLDPAALSQFYSNRQSVYRTPERLQVHYVRFDATNFLAQADQVLLRNTNLTGEIDRLYLASNPSAFMDTNGQVMPPEAAKTRIRQQLRERQAIFEAHKEAARFATNLESLKDPTGDSLVAVAANKGLAAAVTEPFAEGETPRGLKVRANFAEMAYKLTPQQPILLSPIRGDDAVYLIALKQRFPSQVPTLEVLQARVEMEFKQDQAVRLARAAGTNFLQQLTNGMSAGKTFAAVAAEANQPVIALPKFSTAARTVTDWDRRIDLSLAKSAAAGLTAGKASGLVSARDGGFVLCVKARVPVSETELAQELPKSLASLRQAEEYEAANEWFRKQMEASGLEAGTASGESQ